MHILVGVLLGLVLLYFWLIAHWFARVVVFLGLTVVLVVPIALYVNFTYFGGAAPWPTFIFELAGSAVAAWVIASIPIWLR